MTEWIKTSIEERILTITFNRADKKNAITQDMYGAMAAALKDARSNDDVRAILFTAEGDTFTAGNDLVDFQQNPGMSEDKPVIQFLNELVLADKPLVAAVNGPAVGVGLTMLLHCDFVYVSPAATLKAPFVDLALVPEAASSSLLPARIGHARAAEVFMLGKKVTADEAVSWGIANAVVDGAALVETAQKTTEALAARAPQALQVSKMLMRGDREKLAAVMKTEGEYFAKQLQSAEVAEAITAFFQKRPPEFK